MDKSNKTKSFFKNISSFCLDILVDFFPLLEEQGRQEKDFLKDNYSIIFCWQKGVMNVFAVLFIEYVIFKMYQYTFFKTVSTTHQYIFSPCRLRIKKNLLKLYHIHYISALTLCYHALLVLELQFV